MGTISVTPDGVVTTVTLTEKAAMDALSEDDYRDIYQEVRGFDEGTGKYRVSLNEYVVAIHSQFSKALWSKWHTGQSGLNRTMRNELRIAVGQPVLPPTVGEVMAGVNPDARVVRIGDGRTDQVLLVADPGPLVIVANGQVSAMRGRPAPAPCARPRHLVRPVATKVQNTRRLAAGRSWAEVIEAGLDAIERVRG